MAKVEIPTDMLSRYLAAFVRGEAERDEARVEKGCIAIANLYSHVGGGMLLSPDQELHLASCLECQSILGGFRTRFEPANTKLMLN